MTETSVSTRGVHASATFSDILVAALGRYPDRPCLVFGERVLDYREVARQVSVLAQCFASLGLRRGDGIAQLSANGIDAALVQLCAWTCGLRYTPLHPLGSAEDHAFIVQDSGARVLVFEPGDFLEHAQRLVAAVPGLEHALSHGPAPGAEDLRALASRFQPQPLRFESDPDDVVAILYTGGTSGRPKGVTLTSQAMVMNVLLTLSGWEWPQDIRFLCSTPITHATGCMLVPILHRGGTIVLHAGFDAPRFLRTVQQWQITATFLVPTMIYLLTEEQKARPVDAGSLETVIYGASPITPSGLAEAVRSFGPVFMQIYSQSEAPCCATVLRRDEHDLESAQRLTSCGRPMAGITVRVLDDAGRETGDGEVGEVCMRGPSIMRGYWNRPQETAETLRDGWLHTGDLAYRDPDGYLHIVDRKKEMIISGGFNVYPREIEDVLAAHPDVAAVAVIGVPDPKWGEAVKAIVVCRDGRQPGESELARYVRDRKGPVAAPKSVDFVAALPLTALGKPDKKAMRAAYWRDKGRQVN